MMDPMANLDGGSSNLRAGEVGGDGVQREVFDSTALQLNTKKLERIRSIMGIMAGCTAGICGLTGLQGLVCFFALHMTVNLSMLVVLMKMDLKAYTRQSYFGFVVLTDLQQCGLSFMLFWTLFYALVYLF
mmetsp:Transcript_1561/g.2130  ORF Transcript_1561/g.2130 Transcript_1561/m.2130 type:complete len:130 (-) Transcript_1561:37-426(-)